MKGEEIMFIQSTTIKNFNSHSKKISKYNSRMVTQPAYYGANVYYGCQSALVRYVNAKPISEKFNDNVELIKYEDEKRVKIIDNLFDNYLEKDERVLSVPKEKIKDLQALLAPALIIHHKNKDSKAAYETMLQIGKYSIKATCTNDTGSSFTGTVKLADKPENEKENYLSVVLNAKYLTDLLTMFSKESYDKIDFCMAPYDEIHYMYHCSITPIMIVAGQIESIVSPIKINEELYEKSIAATK